MRRGNTSVVPWPRRLLQYCRPHRRIFAAALVATGLAMAAGLLAPLVQRAILDRVVLSDELPLLPCLAALVGAGLVRFGAGTLRRYLAAKLSLEVQCTLRDDLFRALARLDGARQDELQTGQVVSRSTTDLSVVQGLLTLLPEALSGLLLFAFSAAIMMYLSPPLTVVMLFVLPLLAFTASHSNKRLFPAAREAQQCEAAVAGVIDDSVTGIRVVKGFAQEQREIRRFEGAAGKLFTARRRTIRLNGFYGSTLQTLPLLGQVGILSVGGWMAVRGHITLGTFAAFSTYLAEMVGPMRGLAALVPGIHQARASVVRVFEIIDARPLVTESTTARPLPHTAAPTVELENVTFGYTPEDPVLSGLTLSVRAGEILAVVGAPGSGKSTLAALVLRFYDVQQGTVRVGGSDVRDLTLDSLRSVVALAPEESVLFSGTIRDNICYGRSDATEQQLQAAARAAGVTDFVAKMPAGFDTTVGEKGLTLSGGQRQRIALARALVAQRGVLLLDDATSAVDPQTEAEIHRALRDVTRERTTLLIARRRSAVELADRIAVLHKGRLVDLGTHEELSVRCERYRTLLAEPVQAARTAGDPAGTDDDTGGPSVPSAGPVSPAPATPPPRLAALAASATAQVTEAEDSFGLSRLLRPFRAALALGAVLVLLEALGGVLVPLFIRTGIDDGIRKAASGVVLSMSWAAAAVVVVGWAVGMTRIYINGTTAERIRYLLRLRAFAHVHRLDLQYFEREPSGGIMTRMTADVEAVVSFAQSGFATVAVSLISALTVLAILVTADWSLALTVCAALPVLLAATLVFRAVSARAYGEARDRAGALNAGFQESVAGLRASQVFCRTDSDARRLAVSNEAYRSARLRAQRSVALYMGFLEFVPELTVASLLAFGASRVENGSLTVGSLVLFLLYGSLFFTYMVQLSQVLDGYQQAAVGFRRIRELFRTPTGTPQAPAPLTVRRLTGEVRFDRVHFRYRGSDQDAVSGVSLTVPAGQTVAFVGETGAGKSTLVKLVARFYDVTSGAVLIDGHDVRDLDITSYRRLLGFVPQEAYVQAGTVGEAIAYGRPGATSAEVETAARAVSAHETLSRLPGGYDHPVTEGGRNLSAGERQLIALARAQLVDPHILILDEATSALDSATEAVVASAISHVVEGRTALLVAHRLTTAARADRIAVVDRGRVVEFGGHEELLALGGRYAHVWMASVRGRDASSGPVIAVTGF